MTDNQETSQPGEHEPSGASSGAIGTWDDLQVGYYGNPKVKLDERGRLKLPAEFKSYTEKKYGKDFNSFYIVSREGEDAEIYPMPEWQQHLAKVFKLPKSLPARKKLLERYTLYGDRADMDPQGRIQIPEELRNEGLVNVEVKVSGEGTLMRVKPLTSLRASVKADRITDQEVDTLAENDL